MSIVLMVRRAGANRKRPALDALCPRVFTPPMGGGLPTLVSKVAALAVAAVVAASGTTLIVMSAGGLVDVALSESTGGGLDKLPILLLFAIGWSIVLGFAGAFVSLAVAVALFGRGERVGSYVLAGVMAGLLHSLVGAVLKLIVLQGGANDVLAVIIIWGGFALTNLEGWGVVFVTAAAAMLSGALAGRVYARLIGIRSLKRR